MKKSGSKQITEKRLREIVVEEIEALKKEMNEAVDYEGVSTVVNAASKLLKATTAFKGSATHSMLNALTPGLESLVQSLEDMVSNPASYAVKPNTQKVVKLRAVKDGE